MPHKCIIQTYLFAEFFVYCYLGIFVQHFWHLVWVYHLFRVISVWFWHFYIVPFLQLLHFDYFQCFQPVLLFFSLCVLLASDTYFVFSQVNLVWNIYTTELICKKLYKVMLLYFAIVLLSYCLCYYDTIHNCYNSFVYNLTWFIKT